VINSLAQQELLERKGISAVVVPNVFDFATPPWEKDQYNSDLREEFGLTDDDLVLLQATRIVPRKGIELAIDFTAALNTRNRRLIMSDRGLFDGRNFGENSRIVLILAGYVRDKKAEAYKDKLIHKAQQSGVELIFIDERVAADRGSRAGQKIYSLWDTYTAADLVTYPSLREGWGNQFLEAVKAKKPLLAFEYPVYQADIKDKDFKILSLGDQVQFDDQNLARVDDWVIDRAADMAVILLTNPPHLQDVVDHNFEQAQTHYSLEALRGYLKPLFQT
jgi:glycosyltransferase involved in cell wall biosynthesis